MFSEHFDHTSYIFDKNDGDFANIQQETYRFTSETAPWDRVL